MHLLPILSTLRRHRTAALLIALEIALTCAIVSNAIFLINDRLSRMDRPSGVVEDELIRVQLTGIGKQVDAAAVTAADLNALRAIPGVKSVAVTNIVPFGGSSWSVSASTVPDDPSPPIAVAVYMGGRGLIETMGLRLTGRDFTPADYVDFDPAANAARSGSIIVTRSVADRLLPDQNPLGKALYVLGDAPQTIVGVVDRLAPPNDAQGAIATGYAVVVPVNIPYTVGGNYLLRVEPTRRDDVLAAADAALDHVDPNRVLLERRSFAEIRRAFFKQDRAMAYLLIGVALALLSITALGIVGLASFWVQQRTQQIGVRRALGATRGDILRYFQLENFILATAGIALGMVLAYAINLWLMHTYQVTRLPAQFLPAGATLLWLLGQIAVLGPALRAAAISPAIAARTV